MAEEKKRYRIILILAIFVVYALVAAEPVTQETVLTAQWIKSLESSYAEQGIGLKNLAAAAEELIPFELGSHFGYAAADGRMTINQEKKAYVSFSSEMWAEYVDEDSVIAIKNPYGDPVLTLENRYGYPFFLDSRIFVMGSEQNSVSELSRDGELLWSYDFASMITCADAAAGFFLCGTIDGSIALIDSDGALIYSSETSGSRVSAIYGCAMAKDGLSFSCISGLDKQRFIFFEQFGSSWRITHHEFLEDGFKRPVNIQYVDNGSRVVYERENALGLYDLKKRKCHVIPLDGVVRAITGAGNHDLLFLLVAPNPENKLLVVIKYPETIMIQAPFASDVAFLQERGNRLFLGGGLTMAAFDVEKK